MNKRILKGKVISNKMDKTIVVLIEKIKEHSIYRKKYLASKKFKVHNPENTYKIGDVVEIMESKPISKEKRWRVLSKSEARNPKSETKNKIPKTK